MKKKSTKKKKALITVICVIVAVFLGAYIYTNYLFAKIDKKKLPKTNEELGIKDLPINKDMKDKKIENIAFFGLDRRNPKEASRSDSIMIISVDSKNEKVKTTSIMRDTYVPVPGYENTKINHAYAYGGPLLSIKTINSNFDLDIRNYVSVDFFGLEKLIDKVGGIDIEISDAEAKSMNGSISELNKLNGNKVEFVSGGNQTLNGRQAVAYSRVRYVGNGDYERTERQRSVLSKLFVKIKSGGASNIPSLMSTILPYVETSFSNGEILDLSMKVMGFDSESLQQLRIPADGLFHDENIRGMAVLVPDIDANKKKLHEFIYEK